MLGLLRALAILAVGAVVGSCGADKIQSVDPNDDGDETALTVVHHSGNSQSALVTLPLAEPLVLRVTDAGQQPVTQVAVSWEVAIGGGTVSPTSTQTDASGLASANWTLGDVLGEQRVLARTAGVENPLFFRAFALAAPPANIEFIDEGEQSAVASTTLRPTVRVRDAFGNVANEVVVTFSVVDGDGWMINNTATTNAEGLASITWHLGPVPNATNVLRAQVDDITAELNATGLPPQPGEAYFGRNQYIEYQPGDLPVIITAPHGGYLRPDEIPDRTWGTFAHDTNTQELTREIINAFMERYDGKRPHVIFCLLRRIKLDANRNIDEAAQGNYAAEYAWHEYHAFVEAAKQSVIADFGEGFYIDMHGHGHEIPRLELGYMLNSTDLRRTDDSLNQATYINKSSVRTLAATSPVSFPDLIRGPTSLGTLYELAGIPAVPSGPQPYPLEGEAFFSGGYNTGRHGSRNGGPISGVQIEAHSPGVRNTHANRQAFAAITAAVLDDYFAAHYDASLSVIAAGLVPAGTR